MVTQPAVTHLAQLNVGHIRYPTDDPRMAEFMNALDAVNALAERSPGFVWRLKDDTNNATSILLTQDPTFLVNMSGAGSREVGPVALVNGQASLASAVGDFPITVGLAGTWSVRATYFKDTDTRYTAVSPQNTDQTVMDTVNTLFGPNRSEAQPPTKQNSA